MFYTGQKNIKLTSRNEGKLKSYDSCFDLRSWSHDCRRRSSYLRDWMRRDMPVCVIPVCTVSSFLRNMTLKSRGKVTPRCRADCKSKAVLESICTSCHAIKECLRKDEQFGKYFEEEDLETTHWPCERCLEALKSIKMLWKIVTERVYNVLVPTKHELYSACSSRTESVRKVAKGWEHEMVHQALYIQKSAEFILKPTKSLNNLTVQCVHKRSKKEYKSECRSDDVRQIETLPRDIKKDKSCMKSCDNINKCTSVSLKMVNVGCNTNCEDNRQIDFYKNNLECLQEKLNLQSDEITRLKGENVSLKHRLKNKSKTYLPPSLNICNNVKPAYHDILPEPFESYCEDEIIPTKDVESEMIITLKNGKNEDFKHVSMLQVLHKTNASILGDSKNVHSCCKKEEDPMDILQRVHQTFEKIVKREMSIATESKDNAKETCIDVSFHKIHDCRSVPSSVTTRTNNTSASKYEGKQADGFLDGKKFTPPRDTKNGNGALPT